MLNVVVEKLCEIDTLKRSEMKSCTGPKSPPRLTSFDQFVDFVLAP